MAETIKMQKGDVFADICNKPECIANAEREGYHVVKEEPKKEEPKKEEKKSTKKADK